MAQPPDAPAPADGPRARSGAGRVVHIHVDAPAKPDLGAACNGCGVCCLWAPCPLGMLVTGRRTGACDALRWSDVDGRYLCGLVAAPADVLPRRWRWLAPLVRRWGGRWIAAGQGCDADLEIPGH